jgi:hypothetical protein
MHGLIVAYTERVFVRHMTMFLLNLSMYNVDVLINSVPLPYHSMYIYHLIQVHHTYLGLISHLYVHMPIHSMYAIKQQV